MRYPVRWSTLMVRIQNKNPHSVLALRKTASSQNLLQIFLPNMQTFIFPEISKHRFVRKCGPFSTYIAATVQEKVGKYLTTNEKSPKNETQVWQQKHALRQQVHDSQSCLASL